MTFSAGQILTAAALNAIATPGAWTAYTPTWTNLTVGNATQSTSYFQAGKLIVMKIRLVLGSTTVIGAGPIFSLPVAATGADCGGMGLTATYRDVSALTDYEGMARLAGNTSGWLLLKNVAGANDGRATLAAAAPFTWATGDIIDAGLVYQAA